LTENFDGKPGEIVDTSNRLVCMCGDGKVIEILEIQAEGKRKTDTASFLRGHRIDKGIILGE
jgi:methionyl-tRNA formyltransferase